MLDQVVIGEVGDAAQRETSNAIGGHQLEKIVGELGDEGIRAHILGGDIVAKDLTEAGLDNIEDSPRVINVDRS